MTTMRERLRQADEMCSGRRPFSATAIRSLLKEVDHALEVEHRKGMQTALEVAEESGESAEGEELLGVLTTCQAINRRLLESVAA